MNIPVEKIINDNQEKINGCKVAFPHEERVVLVNLGGGQPLVLQHLQCSESSGIEEEGKRQKRGKMSSLLFGGQNLLNSLPC